MPVPAPVPVPVPAPGPTYDPSSPSKAPSSVEARPSPCCTPTAPTHPCRARSRKKKGINTTMTTSSPSSRAANFTSHRLSSPKSSEPRPNFRPPKATETASAPRRKHELPLVKGVGRRGGHDRLPSPQRACHPSTARWRAGAPLPKDATPARRI